MIAKPNQEASTAEGGIRATSSWLICRCGSYLCGLPLARVVETMRPLPIQSLLDAPAFIKGVAVIRGVALPVVDAAALTGGSASTDVQRLVTVKVAEGRQASVAVDAVLGIRAIDAGGVAAMPPLLRNAHAEVVSALGVLDAGLLLFLETARLIPDAVWRELATRGAAL